MSKKKEINDILNGWKNYFLGSDVATLKIAKERAAICAPCPVAPNGVHTAILPDKTIKDIEGMFCDAEKGGCGCPLSPAVRSKNYKCIKGKW